MMSYIEISKPSTTTSTVPTSTDVQTPPITTIAQDIVATEATVREALSKIAPSYGRSIVREPPIDMYDEGDRIVLMIDMPGIPKENIKVRVSIDTVEVSAVPHGLNGGKLMKAERLANFRLYRRIQLPCKIKLGDVKAYLKDGVLYIYLPKLLDTTESLDITIE